jgi:hypothetical protein
MKLLLISAVGLSLAGCVSWSKPGLTEAQFQHDKLECQAAKMPDLCMELKGYRKQ